MSKLTFSAVSFILLLFVGTHAAANECEIQVSSVAGAFTERTDVESTVSYPERASKRSSETILTELIHFKNGSLGVIEQKNCSMWNLTVSVLAVPGQSSEQIQAQLALLLAQAPLAQKYYSKVDLSKELRTALEDNDVSLSKNQEQGLDGYFDVSSENVEVYFEHALIQSGLEVAPYASSTSLYIAVGGMH